MRTFLGPEWQRDLIAHMDAMDMRPTELAVADEEETKGSLEWNTGKWVERDWKATYYGTGMLAEAREALVLAVLAMRAQRDTVCVQVRPRRRRWGRGARARVRVMGREALEEEGEAVPQAVEAPGSVVVWMVKGREAWSARAILAGKAMRELGAVAGVTLREKKQGLRWELEVH